MAALVRKLMSRPDLYALNSGKIQTIVRYRGSASVASTGATPRTAISAAGAASGDLQRRLDCLQDFTLLVIGAVIGADVYVVAALGAALLGPAQLVAWLVGGRYRPGVRAMCCHPPAGRRFVCVRAPLSDR